MTDLALEGVFVWQSDFSRPDYTNWSDSEPAGIAGENCVTMNYDGWSDWGCFLNMVDLADIHALCEELS